MEGESLKIEIILRNMVRPFRGTEVLINLPFFCDNVILRADK